MFLAKSWKRGNCLFLILNCIPANLEDRGVVGKTGVVVAQGSRKS